MDLPLYLHEPKDFTNGIRNWDGDIMSNCKLAQLRHQSCLVEVQTPAENLGQPGSR